MTAAASDRREDLEAAIWRSLAKARAELPAAWKQAHVADILAAADAYARAFRPAAPKKPPAPTAGGPAAVHYAPGGSGHAACRPGDPLSARGWAVSGDVQSVTCGHCRKTPAFEAAPR
jgi:hypothetical protein